MDEPGVVQTEEGLLLGSPAVVAGEPVPSITVNANVDARSLHLHQAMTLTDAKVCERLQAIHPPFMAEMNEHRMKEQEARHVREQLLQEHEARLMLKKLEYDHEIRLKDRELSNNRFSMVTLVMLLVVVAFTVVGIVALIKQWYWPAGGMGLGIAYIFAKLASLIKASNGK